MNKYLLLRIQRLLPQISSKKYEYLLNKNTFDKTNLATNKETTSIISNDM